MRHSATRLGMRFNSSRRSSSQRSISRFSMRNETRAYRHRETADSRSEVWPAFRLVQRRLRATEAGQRLPYQFQKVFIDGDLAGRQLDAFRVFMERNSQLLHSTGITGVVVPSAFHANEGATGVRQLYLEKMALRCCYSFENRRKLFEIDRRFKFALVVAAAGGTTVEFSCAFFLHDDEWLFASRRNREPLSYSLDFVKRTTGDYLIFLEPRSEQDLQVIEVCFAHCHPFATVASDLKMAFGRECDMALDSWRFTPCSSILAKEQDARDPQVLSGLVKKCFLMLHEGRTFRQYDDRWAAAHRRISYRSTSSPTKPLARGIAVLPFSASQNIAGPRGRECYQRPGDFAPGVLVATIAPTRKMARKALRRRRSRLVVCVLLTQQPFDWQLSQRVAPLLNCPSFAMDTNAKDVRSFAQAIDPPPDKTPSALTP